MLGLSWWSCTYLWRLASVIWRWVYDDATTVNGEVEYGDEYNDYESNKAVVLWILKVRIFIW